jgi:hypothetical protein
MKTRQFIVLLVAIFLQPVIMYFLWGYISQEILFFTPDREQVAEIQQDVWKLQDSVSSLVRWSEDVDIKLHLVD